MKKNGGLLARASKAARKLAPKRTVAKSADSDASAELLELADGLDAIKERFVDELGKTRKSEQPEPRS